MFRLTSSRFARAGAASASAGIALKPATAPDFFTEDTPTAVLVRQVLGAIAQFDKASLVAKLKAARDRKKAATGKCGGAGRILRFGRTSWRWPRSYRPAACRCARYPAPLQPKAT